MDTGTIAAIAAGISAVVAAAGGWYLRILKESSKNQTEKEIRIVDMLKEENAKLAVRITSLETELNSVKDKERDCAIKFAELSLKVSFLEQRMNSISPPPDTTTIPETN